MCDTCGCGSTRSESVELGESLLAGNDRAAAHNREHFAAAGVLAVNLMGSPGSGKTALLEATAKRAAGSLALAALSGDLATDRDGERLRAAGIPARSIVTGTACHLDAAVVHAALDELPAWRAADVLVLENVGNLVCPALFDLGEAARIVALSVTEGEDKPLKYPLAFQAADLVLLTKVDLLPHLPGLRFEAFYDALARTAPGAEVIAVSATHGEGMDRWLAWLTARRAAAAHAHEPAHVHPHAHGHVPPHEHDHERGAAGAAR